MNKTNHILLSKNILFLVAFLSLITLGKAAILPIDLRCEYKRDPLGIDNIAPRLSWKLTSETSTRGQKQKAYQILVASSLDLLNKNFGDVWNSGKKLSEQSTNNIYKGKLLKSGKRYYWKVRTWDNVSTKASWSENAQFTMGLLHQQDWKGEWIFKKDQEKNEHNWYRKNFTLADTATSGLVYVGSFGYHELYVNGEKITNNVLNPVSSYLKTRVPYLTYDVSPKLKKGKNVIAIWHAAGWARWNRIPEYNNPPFVFKAQVDIITKKSKTHLATDATWKCKRSNSSYYGDWDILHFGGETIDDRYREDNWNTSDYDDSQWQNASVFIDEPSVKGDNTAIEITEDKPVKKNASLLKTNKLTAILSSQMVEPQVKYELVTPIDVKKNANGSYLVDMGRNYTGFFEMNLYNGLEGDSILFEISDQLEKPMNWFQKSKYIYNRTGKGTFANRFNVAGGRWITIYGLKYTPNLVDIKGYVITNDRKQISKFESSSALLNQIYKLNLDTYIANTLDGILMDCPHRERRGWGEVTVAAMYGDALPNFESGAYMDQYLQYTRDVQLPDGQIRAIINENDRPFLMWKANNPLTVWETYRMLGDKKTLVDNYASMQKWMQWLYENSNYTTGGALKTGKPGAREFPGLGDWCTPRGNFWTSSNSPEAIHFNNCIYAFMLENAVNIAKVLGKTKDAKTYADRLNVQRKATHAMSYDPATGKYINGQQVDQAFALLAGITPESEKAKVSANLVDNVLYKFPYYDTGSSGQGLYTRYFTEIGERMDLIYELLSDKHHPSYGYFIEQGETVWPERWSSVGVSKIHTCYTGIGGYFIKGFGGIRPDPSSPGMQAMILKPAPVGDLTFANTSYQSAYGDVIVNWSKKEGGATFHIEIPINTTAKVYLPAKDKNMVMEGQKPADKAQGITYIGAESNDAVGNYVIYHISSGSYNFEVSQIPLTSYPDPMYNLTNLAQLGRISASSMFIETEKLPGFEAFKANDENNETRWLSAKTQDQYLEVEWVKPQTFNKLVINEYQKNITSYQIQYWQENRWVTIVDDTLCGLQKEHKFDPVTSTKCRVYLAQAANPPSISEFKIYNTK